MPRLVGRFIMDEPGLAVQFYSRIATFSILVDQEVVFASDIFQVALIALSFHKITLAESHVRHVGAVSTGMLGTAEQIECPVNALETADALGFIIKSYVAQNQMGGGAELLGHSGKPLVAFRSASWFCQNNPLVFGCFYTQGNLQLLTAHVA